jgi:hypothetical protein
MIDWLSEEAYPPYPGMEGESVQQQTGIHDGSFLRLWKGRQVFFPAVLFNILSSDTNNM